MTAPATPVPPPAEQPLDLGQPDSLVVRRYDAVLRVTLTRPHKRNALDDATILGLEALLTHLPDGVRALVLDAEGDHFCAGLDLSEMADRDTLAGVQHSRMWHRVFDRLERGEMPVVSVLKGAVVGGGLELASATHVRVAEASTFYALPEGQRGLFVGGGGSVRVPRLIGVARMTDMMLTGRRYDSAEGHAVGFAQYLVGDGEGLAKALDLAARMAANAPQTTFAVLHALPRIAELPPGEGLFVESLMAAIAQGTDDAKSRMADFVAGRAKKVTDD